MQGLYGITTNGSTLVESKTKALQQTLQQIDESSDVERMNVCKQFEAYFLEQVFKSMEKTVMKTESQSSGVSEYTYFKDMLTQEYAKNATETGGYGIAQMLYESMKRS